MTRHILAPIRAMTTPYSRRDSTKTRTVDYECAA